MPVPVPVPVPVSAPDSGPVPFPVPAPVFACAASDRFSSMTVRVSRNRAANRRVELDHAQVADEQVREATGARRHRRRHVDIEFA
ncbi:hypothetical protein GCM10027075_65830 [Streptomyces heilongjiangensis]